MSRFYSTLQLIFREHSISRVQILTAPHCCSTSTTYVGTVRTPSSTHVLPVHHLLYPCPISTHLSCPHPVRTPYVQLISSLYIIFTVHVQVVQSSIIAAHLLPMSRQYTHHLLPMSCQYTISHTHFQSVPISHVHIQSGHHMYSSYPVYTSSLQSMSR